MAVLDTNSGSGLSETIKEIHSRTVVNHILSDKAVSRAIQSLQVKLHSNGIVGKTLGWNKEFLNNRSFCVKLNNTKSNKSLILCRKELNSALYFSFCLLTIL